ncbi:MAG TPA: UvrD-helicase domain-containing protein [bacterium]|nr:UvrD-helicase domain-containing protein [bacterium]
MVKSLLVTASAGSGKTFRLTHAVREHIAAAPSLIVAVTFTNAAAAEMEKRILEKITGEASAPAEKLSLLMRAAQVRFSTIDALFHHLLATEEETPQIADKLDEALIAAAADERFFTHPAVTADTEHILIAARILNISPETLLSELDQNRDTLAGWECPPTYLAELKGEQSRIVAAYEKFREQVGAVADGTAGNLLKQVVTPLSQPLDKVDLSKAIFLKSDIDAVKVAAADKKSAAYATLRELYPPMRALIARYVVNTARLRSALLKRFSDLRAKLVEEEKERRARRYFADIPRALIALDGAESVDRPTLMARLYERGYHRTAHLLLDEFQDTSKEQMELLRPLMDDIRGDIGEEGDGPRSLFLVGDWKQSIYRWRGADPERLREWIAPIVASGQLTAESLPYNWRSTPLLIGFFNRLTAELFAGNDSASDLQEPPPESDRKRPYAGISSVAVIPVVCGRGEDALYERLVAEVQERQRETGCAWGDIAILCRTNAQMDRAARMLAAVPVGTSGLKGRELMSLREGTALVLSLAAIFTAHDGIFIPRALSALGYDDEFRSLVARIAQRAGRLSRPHRFAAVAGALRELASRFPRPIIETVWDEAERYFDGPDGIDAAALLRSIVEMGALITVAEGEHADRVKLATMHGTKGLEFPHVFLLWKEESEKSDPAPHPDDGTPLDLNKTEREFLAADPIPGAAAVAQTFDAAREKQGDETANLLYVAATRAVRSLTILIKANAEGELKGFGERMHRAAKAPLAGFDATEFGHRHDFGPAVAESFGGQGLEELPPAFAERFGGQAPGTDSDDIDPALRSADIEAGIERGRRIHTALARLTAQCEIPKDADLTADERAALIRFLRDPEVRTLLGRPGKALCEQHISDRTLFGIVDRLIVADDRVTLIDYKTGPRRSDLTEKYRLQMERYRTILRAVFTDGRPIDGYLLFIDEKKIVTTL